MRAATIVDPGVWVERRVWTWVWVRVWEVLSSIRLRLSIIFLEEETVVSVLLSLSLSFVGSSPSFAAAAVSSVFAATSTAAASLSFFLEPSAAITVDDCCCSII